MGNSLFDQLKKTGLVDDKKAKKIKHSQLKAKKQQKKKGKEAQADVSEVAQLAQQAQAEKIARDRRLNQAKKDAAEQRAIEAQIKQLIDTSRVEDAKGEIAYHFTDGTHIKRLYISEQVQKSLVSGHLAIAKQTLKGESHYELVPTAAAEKIKQRDAQRVIFIEQGNVAEITEDDPYADYQIPDDLMW